jgi:hypothetical protein
MSKKSVVVESFSVQPKLECRGYLQFASVWLVILLSFFSSNVGADDLLVETLKRQLAKPVIVRAEQFSISGENYVVAALKESFLAEPRIRIFRAIFDSFDEVYEDIGGGYELINLRVSDITDDKIPEIITQWACGQRGLRCINIIGYDSMLRFKQVFVSQASRIELVPKQEGPIEIYLFDDYPVEGGKIKTVKRVYEWKNGNFVGKNNR